MNPQIIEKNGRPEWAIIPYKEFKVIQEAIEDAEDVRDIEENLKAINENNETAIPGEITFATLDGINPIRAWRKYKKIKLNELAKKVCISASYLSQIENEKRNPTIDTLKLIASALGVEADLLI
ncbi:MAG: helix-turn-helix transcriptional regulator [Deltaproteobacteria bacterium]|nr:helix-turn-helix transcriptional regulator [Deltaproteobacteria bacterium]